MELRRRLRLGGIILLASVAQIFTIGFVVSTLVAPTIATAAQSVPYKINFQGRLTDNSGNALSDGLYNVKFRLWTALTAGSNSWEEDRVITGADNRIQVTNGLFNIQFGDLTALSPTLFSNGTYPLYLEVELPTPATATCSTNACAVFTEGAMTPRQPLASTPYAFSADTLDGLDSSAFGQLGVSNTFTGANTFTPASGVGITVRAASATHSLDVKDSSGITQAFFDAAGILNVAQTIQATVATVDLGTNANAFRTGYFSTSVQTPALNATAAGGTITTNLGTLQRVSSGTTTIDLKDAGTTTLAVTNSGGGVAGISATGGLTIGTGKVITVGATAGQTSVVSCTAGQAVTTATFTGGVLTTAPGCTAISGVGANNALSNLAATAINVSLIPASNNSIDAGSASLIFKNVYTGNLDAGTTSTALTIGTAATTTAVTIGHAGTSVSVPGGINSSGLLTTSGNISTTGSGTIASAGAITAPTSVNTINNLVINAGSLSNVGANITGSAALAIASTTGALTLTSGSGTLVLGSNTVQHAAAGLTLDITNAANSTLTVTNSNASFVANLSVEGGVGIGTGQVFSVGAATGSTISACSSAQYLGSAVATGGLVTAGSCITSDLQGTYNNSSAPATISLSDAKNFVINAPDTATDPSVLVNLQCVTCSAAGGRFGVQNNGIDIFTVNPVGSLVVTPATGQSATFNLSGTSSAAFTATGIPTTDLVTISNVGQPTATSGVNGLNITYIGGAGAIESSGSRIDITPGPTSGSTWNGLRIVSTTNAGTGVALNGIKIDGPSSAGTGTATGLNITTGWDIGLNIQSGGIRMAAISDPTAPAIDNLAVYARTISGRTMLKSEGSSGVSYALQPSLFQQNIWVAQAGSANNTAQWQSQGAPGTYTTVPVLTNAGSQTLSYNASFSTAAAANAGNGFMQSTSSYYRGNTNNGNSGFFTTARVAFPGTLANYTSAGLGSRFWSGMTSQNVLATMGANDTPTGDFAGFRLSGSAGETTFRFLTRNNVTTTNQNTGVTLVVGDSYDLYMFVKNYDTAAPTQNTTIYWRIDDLTAGTAPVEGNQTLTLPTVTTALRFMTTLDTVNAAAKQLDIQRMYVETDR
jgi:hypothetical protein